MGSIFRKDRIGNLSEAGGTISLAPSILTIGGKQFETKVSISTPLPSLTANTRYQIFAVNNAGTIQLVISTNENSQGPAGWNAWKLVGSFYSEWESASFDDFVNIEGIPRNRTIDKLLTSDVLSNTNDIADLRVTGLTLGMYYHVKGYALSVINGDSGMSLQFINNGNIVGEVQVGHVGNGDANPGPNISFHFKAESDTLSVDATSITNPNGWLGNNTKTETFIQVSEQNEMSYNRPIKDL